MQSDSEDLMFVNRCLEGDWAAFAFLVDKYKEVVHAYAYHRTSDYQAAQDITQEVLIKAYRKLGQLKWPHRFRSWLYTIASNECKMWLRKHSKEREQEMPLEDVPVEELDEIAVRNHSDEDTRLTVKSAIETLPTANRLALSLHYMSGLSVKEIAEFMGISPNNVKVRLHRARKQLGERLTNMVDKQMKKEKLRSGFVLTMMNTIRNMPIPSLPNPRPIRWAPISLSVGVALLIGVIGLGVSTGRDVSKDMPVLKFAETPIEVSLIPELDEQFTIESGSENELVATNTEDNIVPKAGGSSGKGITIRKVEFSKQVMGGTYISPSPDGRYLSFANGENGNLAIYNLTTGESRDVTDEGNWEGAQRYAMNSTWSPDGVQIAYHWYNEDTQELRIIGLDGSEPRVLYLSEESRGRISGCYDWSQDGKYILARLAGTQEIVLISVDDGSIQILKSPAPEPEGMILSPDGRYIVYDRQVDEDDKLRDIFLLATDGSGEETRLTEHPADDYDPVWSPDGRVIVFVSNRDPSGTSGLWLMQVADGKPVEVRPQLVKREVGDILPLGFTQEGSLYYITKARWSDIYVTSVDMETGKTISPPELLRSQGINTMPTWSPDGKSLAYVSERTSPGSFSRRIALIVRSMDTGEEREIRSKPGHMAGWPGQLRWSPDGRSILLGARPIDDLHLINVQTGHVTAGVATGKGEGIWGPAWSPDGKVIFFTRERHEKEDWPCRIVALNLGTRQERELYAGGSRGSFLAVSPDGQQLAFSDKDREVIKVISTEGGEPRALLERKDLNLQDTDFFGSPFAWTPDGRYVLFTIGEFSSDEQGSAMVELWRIPAEGGRPQKVLERELTFHIYLCPLSLHPDGRRIAFQKSDNRQIDLWVMSNLLSTASRIP